MSRADAGPHVVSPELAKLLADLRVAERIVQDEANKVREAQQAVCRHHDAHEKAKLEVQKICDHIRAEVSR